jgi:hypothetical protein
VGAVCATGVGCVILAAVVAGAVAGGASYGTASALGDDRFSVRGLATNMSIGAVVGGLTAGAGQALGPAVRTIFSRGTSSAAETAANTAERSVVPAAKDLAETGASKTATKTAETAPGAGWLSDAARAKVPEEWGAGAATKKGVGVRWTDPEDPGNGIRIDRGSPLNPQETQQVDHVIVRSGGQVIGRSGQALTGSIKDNAVEAHIPLSEWGNWSEWSKP